VLFTATYQVYGDVDRARMLAAYQARGYTHWAIGPIGRRAPLYHDQYPAAPFDSIAEPDKYANLLEELWRAGEIPVYFALPDTPDFMGHDGWNWEAIERDLTPVYASPRWQALVRVAVLVGSRIFQRRNGSVACAGWPGFFRMLYVMSIYRRITSFRVVRPNSSKMVVPFEMKVPPGR
jgi:hypothetical protein